MLDTPFLPLGLGNFIEHLCKLLNKTEKEVHALPMLPVLYKKMLTRYSSFHSSDLYTLLQEDITQNVTAILKEEKFL